MTNPAQDDNDDFDLFNDDRGSDKPVDFSRLGEDDE